MTKKLLFATLSLAALAACTDNDFESQKVAEELTCPVKFTVINNDAQTRAYMDGSTIRWEATKGDLFTLYHGVATDAADITTGYWNAAYKAQSDGSQASLSTPTMIKQGYAVMFWPADTTFRIKTTDHLSIVIPELLKAKDPETGKDGLENHIPYVSDLVEIKAYDPTGDGTQIGYKNTAGKDREYPVYMRPMASQLTINADYAGTDAKLAEIATGDDAITPIKVTSIDLLTDAGTEFTKEIPVIFTDPTPAMTARWAAATGKNAGNNWKKVTTLDVANIAVGGKTTKLTTECLDGNAACKFLILPQAQMNPADAGVFVKKAAVVVNTIYGRVLVGDPTEYNALPLKSYYAPGEYENAWYRYVTADVAPAENLEEKAGVTGAGVPAGKFKVVAKNPKLGMKQTINWITNKVASSGLAKDEPVGTSLNRYVMVNLEHLDMSDLHIKSDKQLRDVARVWKQMNLEPVTVYLDGGKEGDAAGEFTISQNTIDVINDVNKNDLGNYINPLPFTVKPCVVVGEECTKIVVTGGGNVRDMAFIVDTDGNAATDPVVDVVLKAEETWNWQNTVKVAKTGVNVIYNEGTLQNATTATLKTFENDGTQNNVRLYNKGTWNITAGTLNVQFDVTNLGIVNIFNVAQYRQDGAAGACTFSNMALSVPQRFLDALGIEQTQQIGKVVNNGVFATVANGKINNYGLIEHAAKTAKTYITSNQRGGNYGAAYSGTNKMGRINLPFSNKDEDNISISAAAEEGFVSVTVTEADLAEVGITDGILSEDAAGTYVNYIIVNSGITKIAELPAQIKYVEFDQKDAQRKPIEVAWELNPLAPNATYDGLIVLSDVNIKLGTTIDVKKATFLAADMYVAGVFKYNGAEYVTFPDAAWDGYYGATHTNYATKYITFK